MQRDVAVDGDAPPRVLPDDGDPRLAVERCRERVGRRGRSGGRGAPSDGAVTAHRRLREVAGDLAVGGARRQPAAEERVGASRGSACCSRGILVGRSAKNQVSFFIAQPIVWAWRSVITSRGAGSPRRVRIPFALPASGASSTSRFSQHRRGSSRGLVRAVYSNVATTSTRSPSESVPASSWLGVAEDGDSALAARELGEDAALCERLELAERDLLALVDRVRQRPWTSAAQRSRPSRGRRRGLGTDSSSGSRPRRRVEPAVPAGMSREATRTFTRPAPCVDVVPIADDVDADEHGREYGERQRQSDDFEFWVWSREFPFAFYC